MTSLWVQEQFLQHCNISLQTDSVIARGKLFDNAISMFHFPIYYTYEMAFTAIVHDCKDLSESDQLAWFFKGMTRDWHIAMCRQSLSNLPWPSLVSCMGYTRGHILRFPLTLNTPANFISTLPAPPSCCRQQLRGSLPGATYSSPRLTRALARRQGSSRVLAEVAAAMAPGR